MSSLPTFTKTWDFTGVNQRITFSSLNDTSATYLYGIKNYLVATMGASVVYSCDGTTGPTSGSDHTDRWSSKANCTTRGANAASAQSFIVLTWAGVQLLLTYQGASDDIFRISMSQGSLFTPAGTATNQPTATDENVVNAAVSQINATTSADRVFSIMATTDKTVFRCAIFRQGTLINFWGLERILEAPNVTSGVALLWSTNTSYANIASAGAIAGTPSGANAIGSQVIRVNGVNGQSCGGSVFFNGAISVTAFSAIPELNGGAPLYPIFVGSEIASNTGWVGTRYDMFFPYTNGATLGDSYDDLTQNQRCILFGGAITPFDPTKTQVTS